MKRKNLLSCHGARPIMAHATFGPPSGACRNSGKYFGATKFNEWHFQ
jgi:hypothetical protein